MSEIPPLSPVNSSNIAALGHDPSTKKLYVQFKGGTIWVYHAVEDTAHQALAEAASVGSHFARFIRGAYRGEMLPAEKQKSDPTTAATELSDPEAEKHPLAGIPGIKDAP